MENIKNISSQLEQAISKLGINGEPNGLYEPIRYILSLGGKRVRPLMTLLATQLYTDVPSIAMPQALAIEVFHNFTLLHDDIMDEAPLRRNQTTVHIKWNVSTGILSGDAMLIKAYQLLSATPDIYLPEILNLFNETALGVCEGQQLDMEFEERDNVSIPEYIEMIRLKTSVLLACALKTGSIIGGADTASVNLLYDVGENLGIAFQLQDDILDAFGTAKIGKRKGGDIISNKKTFLLITALQNAKGELKTELEHWLSVKTFDNEEKVAAVLSIFEQLKIQELATAEMNKYSDKAFELFAALDVEEAKKANMISLMNTLMFREF